MSDPEAIIEKLRTTLDGEKGLADLLERSLAKARASAEAELNPELFAALECPRNLREYGEYLRRFVRWVPHESDAEAWNNEKRQAQEVSDRMSHFYFLVDQKTGDEAPQNAPGFRDWMTEFARGWSGENRQNRKFGNIKELIEGRRYADSFAGGTFVHYMLPVHAYHRYHLPIGGLVKESYRINGEVFMHVGIEDHDLKGSDSATSGYEFSQTRGVVTIDTAQSNCGDIGIVAVIPVGMAHVSSVVLTSVQDRHMAKGEARCRAS